MVQENPSAKQTQRHKQKGFTIAEVMIAILITGFMAASLTTLFMSIQKVQAQASYVESANRAAQREIESLRNTTYNGLVVGQNINFTPLLTDNMPTNATGTVVVTEPIQGIKRVDVTVSYTYGGVTRNITLSSLIGVLGITK